MQGWTTQITLIRLKKFNTIATTIFPPVDAPVAAYWAVKAAIGLRSAACRHSFESR